MKLSAFILFCFISMHSWSIHTVSKKKEDTLSMNLIYHLKKSNNVNYSYGFLKYTGNTDSLIYYIEKQNGSNMKRAFAIGKKVFVCNRFTKPYLIYGGQSLVIKLNKKKQYTEVLFKMNPSNRNPRTHRIRHSFSMSYQGIIDELTD